MSRRTKIENLRKSAMEIDAKMEKLHFRKKEIMNQMKVLYAEEKAAEAARNNCDDIMDTRVPVPTSSMATRHGAHNVTPGTQTAPSGFPDIDVPINQVISPDAHHRDA